MSRTIRIGTRQSELATWQATTVASLLAKEGYATELVFVKSDGDIDLQTPLYEMGVQGIFTRSLDIALLNNHVDIVVHSMKDVPTQLPSGIREAAILKRGNWRDLLVFKESPGFTDTDGAAIVATSSIRRRAQWLRRYPRHALVNLRGNVNTRLLKLHESDWNAAIFAAAGLERINLRPVNSVELDWMLPAPAQGAILVVCRSKDDFSLEACSAFHDQETALCVNAEREFLRTLMGGCSTPIAAVCEVINNKLQFKGNILSPDGTQIAEIEKTAELGEASGLGTAAGEHILRNGGHEILAAMNPALKTV